MRTLPIVSVQPHFGRRVPSRRQLNRLHNTWPYGYSMPIPARYIVIGAPTEELSQELSALLGTVVNRVPQILPSGGYVAPVKKAAGGPAVVGIMGGARTEKGSHLIRAIIGESRRLGRVDFAV